MLRAMKSFDFQFYLILPIENQHMWVQKICGDSFSLFSLASYIWISGSKRLTGFLGRLIYCQIELAQ